MYLVRCSEQDICWVGSSCKQSVFFLSNFDFLISWPTSSLTRSFATISGVLVFDSSLWAATVSISWSVIFHTWTKSWTIYLTFSFSLTGIHLIMALFLLLYCSIIAVFIHSYVFLFCNLISHEVSFSLTSSLSTLSDKSSSFLSVLNAMSKIFWIFSFVSSSVLLPTRR